jgi:hypothetical protein
VADVEEDAVDLAVDVVVVTEEDVEEDSQEVVAEVSFTSPRSSIPAKIEHHIRNQSFPLQAHFLEQG